MVAKHYQSNNAIDIIHRMKTGTHYLRVCSAASHTPVAVNTITHTTRPATQHDQSHNTIDIIHRIQTVTHCLRVCRAVSHIPVAQYN